MALVSSTGFDRLAGMYPRISQGRRMLGITIDWIAAYAVTLGFFAGSGTFLERSRGIGGTVLLVLALEYLILVSLGGSSFGHRIVGLKVVRFSDGGVATPLQALIRTLLMVIIITAITFDENGRGVNERLSNTVLISTRA
jgi:uncharacterized RDD family membrane protein YckC